MSTKIAVILGSENDKEQLQAGFDVLKEFDIPYQCEVISAHRHPDTLRDYCQKMESQGIEVVIACAGMAAALPGFIASYVNVPVIGVALKGGMMDGLDALLAMTSIPKGLGLVSSGIGKSAFINAIISALQIIALHDDSYKKLLGLVKKKFQ